MICYFALGLAGAVVGMIINDLSRTFIKQQLDIQVDIPGYNADKEWYFAQLQSVKNELSQLKYTVAAWEGDIVELRKQAGTWPFQEVTEKKRNNKDKK